MANNYRDSVNGATVVPQVGTVPLYGRLYASADCTATITFGDGRQIVAFPINKGYHPMWVKAAGTASAANTLYIVTNDRV